MAEGLRGALRERIDATPFVDTHEHLLEESTRLRGPGGHRQVPCDDARLFQEWALQWRGSGATFEIVPVVPSKETREVVAPYLDQPDP